MVIIQTTSLIYDRSAGKLAVAGGTSPRGTERRSPVVDLHAETNSYRRVHRRKRIRSQPNKNWGSMHSFKLPIASLRRAPRA